MRGRGEWKRSGKTSNRKRCLVCLLKGEQDFSRGAGMGKASESQVMWLAKAQSALWMQGCMSMNSETWDGGNKRQVMKGLTGCARGFGIYFTAKSEVISRLGKKWYQTCCCQKSTMVAVWRVNWRTGQWEEGWRQGEHLKATARLQSCAVQHSGY